MNMFKKLGILFIVISLTISFYGCKSRESSSETSYNSEVNTSKEATKGYIWKAQKGEKVIHLIGTKHPSPQNINFFNDKLNEIIDNADVLGVELDITDSTLLKETQTLLNDQYISKEGTVKERLSNEEFAKLEEITKDLDISYGQIKNFSNIGISAMISSATIQKTGYTGTSLDQQLITKFKKDNKDIKSLESPKIQADALRTTQSLNDLGGFLLEYDSNTYLKNQSKIAKEGFDAYIISDKDYPEKYFKDERAKLKEKGTLEIFDEMNKRRNVEIVKKINDYIEENKNYVIAIGYMHFFGEDSIIKLLEENGYEITDLVQ
ncbi:MAG: TraB/GumN family protein [Sarcina sp.]